VGPLVRYMKVLLRLLICVGKCERYTRRVRNLTTFLKIHNCKVNPELEIYMNMVSSCSSPLSLVEMLIQVNLYEYLRFQKLYR
jgi:hypothetical protein